MQPASATSEPRGVGGDWHGEMTAKIAEMLDRPHAVADRLLSEAGGVPAEGEGSERNIAVMTAAIEIHFGNRRSIAGSEESREIRSLYERVYSAKEQESFTLAQQQLESALIAELAKIDRLRAVLAEGNMHNDESESDEDEGLVSCRQNCQG